MTSPGERAYYPASANQKRMYVLNQLSPGGIEYNVPIALRLEGKLDVGRLREALSALVARHASLRTSFKIVEEEVVQQVKKRGPARLPRRRAKSKADFEEIKRSFLRPFDLHRAPLFRACLIRLERAEHFLLLDLHHIICDGVSIDVLLAELGRLYAGQTLKKPGEYKDFALWQRRFAKTAEAKRQEEYWLDLLGGDRPVLSLSTDYPRKRFQSFDGGRVLTRPGKDLTAALRALVAKNRVSMYMLLLSAYYVLLSKYTGQEDITVGTLVAGRGAERFRDLIGLFVNTLALRSRPRGELEFVEHLKQVRGECLSAFENQDYQFEDLVDRISPPRDLGRNPLFDTMFGVLSYDERVTCYGGVDFSRHEIDYEIAKFDLSLTAIERQNQVLVLEFEYCTELFRRETIERLSSHYLNVLREVVANPCVKLSDINILSAEERRNVVALPLREVGKAERAKGIVERSAVGRDLCLHELFEAQARRTPDAVALEAEEGRLTYAELNAQAGVLAGRLRRLGVAPEVLVAVFAERRMELVVALLAILKAGGAYVPLDPNAPRERTAFLLRDAGVAAVLAHASLQEQLPPTDVRILTLDGLAEACEGSGRVSEDGARAAASNLAYLIYTSGSTGRPKAVAIEHRSAVGLIEWSGRVFDRDELAAVLAATSITFDLSVYEIFLPLAVGGRIVLARDALHLPVLPAAARVTLVNTVPSAIAELVRIGALPASVRTVNLAGEPLPRALVDAVYAVETVEKVYNLYGPSEDTTYTTWLRVPRHETREPSVGRPIDGTHVYLLDASMEPVPVGVLGELYVGGDGLARGYLGRPGLSAECFVADPFSAEPGARLYRTGDLGRCRDDGQIDFLGRLDFQVKIRGFRIELGEIEAHLARIPTVRESVVAAVEAPGAGAVPEKRLAAWVVRGSSVAELEEEAWLDTVRASLADALPPYMVPSRLVLLDALPRTPNGKVDRKSLPRPEWGTVRATTGEAPRTPLEEEIAAVFAAVLGLGSPPGVGESFFALGGHSLLALRAVARLNAELGTDLPMRALFEAPTVAEMAARVEALREAASSGVSEGSSRGAPPVELVERGGQLPLSLAQERLWFLDQMTPDSPVYNVPSVLELRGLLRLDALQHALDGVLARHEALRTTFAPGPKSVIHPRLSVDLGLRDLSAQEDRERAARAAVDAEIRRPFRLEEPLVRSLLVRFGDARHLWALTVHHIVFDGWSIGLLMEELRTLYTAYVAGRPPELPELPVQYVDFAVWQRRWLAGEEGTDGRLRSQLIHWKQRLAGAPAVLELPADRPRPQIQSQRGRSLSRNLAPRLLEGLSEVGEESTSRFMKLLAVFAVQVHRITGRDDFLLGMPIAHRARPELESLIGYFVNTLVLRLDLSGDPSYRQLVERVRACTLDAFAHQDVPFERLVEELEPRRDLSRDPLVQVLFTYEREVRRFDLGPGLEAQSIEPDTGTAKFDLSLHVLDSDRPQVVVQYRSDLFDDTTAERLLDGFETLLAGAVGSPDARVSELPLLTPAEARRLAGFSRVASLDLPQLDVVSRFAAQVRERPDAEALVWSGGCWTYQELDVRSNRLARRLQALGVGTESPVGVSLERSPELVLAILAIVKAGGCYVPFDAHYPRQRLAYLMADSGIDLLVTDSSLAGELPSPEGVRTLLLDREADRIAVEDPGPLPGRMDGDQALYVLYTSGSTGRPKGVVIPHRGVVRLVVRPSYLAEDPAAPPEVDGDCTFLFAASISFDASTFEIWGGLLNGGRLAVAPPGKLAFEDLAAAVADLGVDHMVLNAGLFHPLVEEHVDCFRAVRHLAAGGDVLSPVHCRRVLEHVPGLRLHNVYGPTENTTFTSVASMDRPEAVTSPVSIGRPISHTSVHVVDRRLRAVPVGVPGELVTGGDGLARGYSGRPALTAERFVPDPFGEAGGRLYRTGDLVRWLEDGSLSFLGRMDHQVKVRGFRIEPGEIETLLEEHPAVAKAIVVAFGSDAGDKRLAAYVVTDRDASGEGADVAALRAFAVEKLPDYMVPSAFVELAALPLTPTGKPDRKALPEPDWGGRSVREGAFIAARTPVEEAVAEIWTGVLELARRPGVDEDFFALGGHSLLATRVVSRLRELFAVELPLQAVFEAPTVAGMARQVEALDAGSAPLPPLEPVPRDAAAKTPLSFAQQRLWFLHQLHPDDTSYHMAGGYLLRGPLDAAALERALQALEARHESLRTRFLAGTPQPVQAIEAPAPRHLESVDLSSLPADERDRKLRQLGSRLAEEPFDLTHGPVWRSALARLGEDEHALFLVVHHIVSDGWSFGVFLRELGILYSAAKDPRVDDLETFLPELGIQYADFAAWQRRVIDDEMLAPHLDYWKEALAGVQPLRLPADGDLAAEGDSRGGEAILVLSASLTRDLHRLAVDQNATLFMSLLAALQVLLGRLARQDDVVVGSPLAGRDHTSTEGVLGCFLETLALRTDLSGRPTFRQLLARVRETVLGAYAHRHVPFEKLVEELQPKRQLTRHPFFDVLLNVVNLPPLDASFEGLEAEPLSAGESASKLWMTLYTEERNDVLELRLVYRRALFSERRMADLLSQLEGLLAQVTADCDRTIDAYSLVGKQDDPRLPDPTAPLPMPEQEAVAATIAGWAERRPEAPALRRAGRDLSYGELWHGARTLAGRLRAAGLEPGQVVAVTGGRSFGMVTSVVAVLASGGVLLTLDPRLPRERRRRMLELAGARFLLDAGGVAEPELLAGLETRLLAVDPEARELGDADLVEVPPPPAADEPAYVFFTSGSTGTPKGVLGRAAGLAHFLAWQRTTFEVGPGDLAAQLTGLSFDVVLRDMLMPLTAGATLVLPEVEGSDLLPWLAAERITRLHAVPSLARTWLAAWRAASREDDGEAGLPDLRTVFFAGEPLTDDLVRDWRRTFGAGCEVANLYGPTETTLARCCFRLGEEPLPGVQPVGRPLPETQALVLAGERPCGLGEPGEIVLRTPFRSLGYLAAEEEDKRRFFPNPFTADPGDLLYRSGDLGAYRPDGTLAILGRVDDQVKIRGVRVELGEIQAVTERHPRVAEAVAVAAADGRGERRLAVYFVAAGEAPTISELRRFLLGQLPEPLVPSAFVGLDALPLNANGKVDHAALPEVDESARPPLESVFVAPRSELERRLSELWQRLLGREHVGVDDNFFELGGHSLLLVEMQAALPEVAGASLPVVDLFRHPTVGALARRLRPSEASAAPAAGVPAAGVPAPSQDDRRQRAAARRRHLGQRAARAARPAPRKPGHPPVNLSPEIGDERSVRRSAPGAGGLRTTDSHRIEVVMSQEGTIPHAIQSVVDLYQNRFDLLRAAEAPKVGWVSIETPEEIFLAAGVIPFRMTGEAGTSASEAGALLSNNYCSYVLGCFSEGLSGKYDFADGVIFADACDMRKRLWEAWGRDVPSSETYFLELPSDASDLSKEYFALQLRKLIKALEERYDREISEAALRDSIALCNQSRALMQRLYQYKKGGRQVLSGEQSIQVVKAATTGLKEPFNAKMSTLLDALEAAEKSTARKRHRVMICGSYFDHKGIIETIEGADADLVCEDISNGVKYFEGRIDPDAEPVAAIADFYLEKNTSARRLDTDVRVQHILDLVDEYRVDSIIYYSLKFCDTNLHDYPYVKERLRAEKIPVLFIEGERNATNIAGTKTRIQTFLESRLF